MIVDFEKKSNLQNLYVCAMAYGYMLNICAIYQLFLHTVQSPFTIISSIFAGNKHDASVNIVGSLRLSLNRNVHDNFLILPRIKL